MISFNEFNDLIGLPEIREHEKICKRGDVKENKDL